MNFKHIPNGHFELTEELRRHTEDKLMRLSHLLLKESDCAIHYSTRRYECIVEVIVTNPNGHFKAQARSDSFDFSIDEVVHKLASQFSKHKEKMQEHSKFDRSKQGRIKRLSPSLEYDNSPYRNPTGKRSA